MNGSPELEQFYRSTVLHHSQSPHNRGPLADADRQATGHNPLCGDRLTVYLRIDDDGIIDCATFDGDGCAISLASASIMTDMIGRRTAAAAGDLAGQFARALADPGSAQPQQPLAALTEVRDYPARIRCALLAWKTLEAALGQQTATVSTERQELPT